MSSLPRRLVISLNPRLFQNFLQYDRIVVLFVMCTVYQGNRYRLREIADAVQFLAVFPKLDAVAALELRPARRIVAEPLP